MGFARWSVYINERSGLSLLRWKALPSLSQGVPGRTPLTPRYQLRSLPGAYSAPNRHAPNPDRRMINPDKSWLRSCSQHMTTFTLTSVFMDPNGLNAALDFSGVAYFLRSQQNIQTGLLTKCQLGGNNLERHRDRIGVAMRLM